MPIRKKFQRLTATDAQHDVPDELGVFEVADMTGRVLFIGSGNLRTCLVTLATHHPDAAGYRYAKTRSRRHTVERYRELQTEHEELWMNRDFVGRVSDPEETNVAPWWPGPRRKILGAPRDLAIRWNGGWIPLEHESDSADEMVFGADLPGGGSIELLLAR